MLTDISNCVRSGRALTRFVPLTGHALRIFGLFFAMLFAAGHARGEIHARVVAMGFPFEQGWGYRIGSWLPVMVELNLVNEYSFDGVLQVQHRDRDGDACFDEVEVHLLQNDDGSSTPRRYTLYAAGLPVGETQNLLSIQLLAKTDAADPGRLVEVIADGAPTRSIAPPTMFQPISDDATTVLSIGEGTVSKVAKISLPRTSFMDRPAFVAHISPKLVPDRWQGLEMIDRIVWDDADPTQLNDGQTAALIEWIRRGGMLIIGAGRTAPALADSEAWGKLLPVDVAGVESVVDLIKLKAELPESLQVAQPETRDTSSEADDPPKSAFIGTMNIARCTARAGTRVRLTDSAVLASDKDSAKATSLLDPVAPATTDPKKPNTGASKKIDTFETTLISERNVDRGQLVLVAGSFSELFAADVDAVPLFRALMKLRDEHPQSNGAEFFPLFQHVVSEVGFVNIGTQFLFLALFFMGVYVCASTLGAWQLLKKRGWERHNWSAFAVCAALATVLSLLAVQMTRGWGKQVEYVSVVDANANEMLGRATSFFGVRTSVDNVLDVWLPENQALSPEPTESPNYLKPLPVGADLTAFEGQFTDPVRYRTQPSEGLLRDVRFRATVKQFEGRWQGELPGWLEAAGIGKVVGMSPAESSRDGTVRRATDKNLEEQEQLEVERQQAVRLGVDVQLRGTITNHFKFPLKNCVVIHAAKDVYPDLHFTDIERFNHIYVLQAGDLAPGQTFDLQNLYREKQASGSTVSLTFDEWSKDRTLKSFRDKIGSRFRSVLSGGSPLGSRDYPGEPWQHALLLGTTASDDLAFDQMGGLGQKGRFGRERLRTLDMMDRVDTTSFLFVGFAEETRDAGGPVKICTRAGSGDFRPVPVTKGLMMYRFLVPIELSEGAAGPNP